MEKEQSPNYFQLNNLGDIKHDLNATSKDRLKRLVRHLVTSVFSTEDLQQLMSNDNVFKALDEAVTLKKQSKFTYCLMTPTGSPVYWTGKGRMPQEIGAFVASGGDIKDISFKKSR